MGLAMETIAGVATNPGATATVVTMNTGDSNRVRDFADSSSARLLELLRQGATEGLVGVRSSLLHDVNRGIRFTTTETPFRWPFPAEIGQPMYANDNLIIEVAGGTAETDAVALTMYYDDLPGAQARLHTWGDISGSIVNVKPLEVDFTTSATAGAWNDTAITTTENLLHADRSYAVLGYITDTAMLAVGLKGQETGNLRACGPGLVSTDITADWFLENSNRQGRPMIPVFSANNAPSVFVSAAAVATSTAVKVQLFLAELAKGFSG